MGYVFSGVCKEMVIVKFLYIWIWKCGIVVSYFVLCIFGEVIYLLYKSCNCKKICWL